MHLLEEDIRSKKCSGKEGGKGTEKGVERR
jgi:hypothetical protein